MSIACRLWKESAEQIGLRCEDIEAHLLKQSFKSFIHRNLEVNGDIHIDIALFLIKKIFYSPLSAEDIETKVTLVTRRYSEIMKEDTDDKLHDPVTERKNEYSH